MLISKSSKQFKFTERSCTIHPGSTRHPRQSVQTTQEAPACGNTGNGPGWVRGGATKRVTRPWEWDLASRLCTKPRSSLLGYRGQRFRSTEGTQPKNAFMPHPECGEDIGFLATTPGCTSKGHIPSCPGNQAVHCRHPSADTLPLAAGALPLPPRPPSVLPDTPMQGFQGSLPSLWFSCSLSVGPRTGHWLHAGTRRGGCGVD